MSLAQAKKLRGNMTDAERKLWFALRDRRFANYKFRRQVPMGRFIADFICFSALVVVEVDGGQHAESRADEVRDRWFTNNDFLVMRFWNNDVMQQPISVMEDILAKLVEP